MDKTLVKHRRTLIFRDYQVLVFLLTFLLTTFGVKASNGVKFNSAVRYSQWAINSRANDFYANTTDFGLAKYGIDSQPITARKDTKKKLDYVPGLVAKAMIEAADYYNGFDWSKPWFLSVKEYGDAYYNTVENTGGSLDNLNAVKLYFGIYNNPNSNETDKANAKTAISSAQAGLVAHNKDYSIQSGTLAGDGVVGGWFHKTAYNNQMWLDGAYMGSALLAQIVNFNGTSSNIFGSTTDDWNMVFKQLNIVWNMCWNSTDNLMYHAFEANAGRGTSYSHADTWAGRNGKTESYTFHSAAYWGRANAWYLLALVDVLEAMNQAGQSSTENYNTLKKHLADLAAGIAARQDNTMGGWYQLLDKDATYTASNYNSKWSGKPNSVTNYIETSATAIIAAAYLKATRLNLLTCTTQYDYKTIAKNAFEGLVNNFTYLDNKGNLEIWGSCKSAGLGGGTGSEYAAGGSKYRDGSNEYYLLGYDVPMVKESDGITEGKVLGGFIMAATEYERAYQSQTEASKQILFANDLKSDYDFSSTAGSLSVEVCGTGTDKATYQWYKGESKIDNATEATYTPTESGEYHCVASANGISITSSTANVKAKASSSEDKNNSSNSNSTIFSYEFTDGTKVVAGKEYNAGNGGTISFQKGSTFDATNGYKLDGDTKYVKVTLANNTLKEGDIIEVKTNSTGAPNGIIAKDEKGNSTTISSNNTKGTHTSTYTVTASDVLKGKTSFYLYRNTKTTGILSISITRKETVTKTNLTATFASNSLTASEGDASVDVPALTVKAGDTELSTSDYNVTYASTNESVAKVKDGKVVYGSKGTATITATITPTATNKYNNTTASFTVTVNEKPADPTKASTIYDLVNNVGTTTNGTNCTASNGKITLGSDYRGKEGKYITIAPSNGGFKTGDVITIKGYCDSKNASGVEIHSNATGESIFKTNTFASSSNNGTEYTFTLTEDCANLYLGRFGGGYTYITGLTVTRPADSGMTRLSAAFAKNNDVVLNTKGTLELPALTVKAGDTELRSSDYKVTYLSNAENVVTVSDNTLTIKGTGVATITATIDKTTVNETEYEGCTATYQITVKAPSQLNISVYDVTANTTDAEVEQPDIRVYGDNDQLLKQGTDYTLSFSVKSGTNVSVKNGIFNITGSNYNWTKGTTVFTIKATPTSSLGETYTAGSLDFTYDVVEGKNKPAFLASFAKETIKLQKNSKNRTFIVPLIYDGEDVSSYFTYTYTKDGSSAGTVKNDTLTYTADTEGTFTIKVNASVMPDYKDVYDNPDEMSFTLDVKSTYDLPTVDLDPTSISMYTGTTEGLPDVTVKVNGSILDDSKYTTTWTSFAPGIVKIIDNTKRIEGVTEGTAQIRVTIKGANLETKTAFATIYVDDPALYRVKDKSTALYGNQRIMWNQDKTLSVVLGGWMFPNPGNADGDLTSEKLTSGKDYQWKTEAEKARWKLTGFDYFVLGDENKNARQENGSNSMPETTIISNVDYTIQKEIVDPMFNVPASGSYLVFNPKTNGTVTAHIFQNGVFDKTGTNENAKIQYRPQRRVFIMDEAGNFVSSDAHIESTTGKPTGGVYDLNQYTWDMGQKGSPTVELVKSHFTGLNDFTMTQDGFKNNIYESNLSQDVAPNNAAVNHPDVKGSHGWCVLADSPVTYTFKVKAGKTYYLYNFGSKIGFYGFSFDEDATAPIVDEINYDENSTNTVKNTETGHVAKVSINRSFKKGIWTTCVLPFSLNKQQVDAIFGTTYGVTNDGNGNSVTHSNGTQILYFDRIEGSKAYFVRHAYNTIVAGKPFLIKPAQDVESINTANVKDYPYVTIENETPADWCKSNGYVWKSSYSNDMTVKEGDCFISNSEGTFKNYRGKSGTLKGFRGFLQHDKTSGAKPMMLSIATSTNIEDNPGSTTGIDLVIDADDNTISGPTTGKIYNVNGQLVSDNIKDLPSLPSGIYIINGKKYIK